MSNEEENLLPLGDDTFQEAAPSKPAAKKATKKAAKKATKKAAKKRARKTRPPADSAEKPGESPEEAKKGPPPTKSDEATDEVTFAPGIVVEDEKGPEPAPEKSGEPPRNGKTHPSRPEKRKPEHRPQNKAQQFDRQKGGSPFKKNKRNRNKNKRWQNKNNKDREEETPIELGDLPEWDVLERLDRIGELAAELKSGSGEPLDYDRIYNMGLTELRGEAAALEVETKQHAPNRDQLLNAITAGAGEAKAPIFATGVLELFDDDEGGVLVYERDNYRIKALSAYVPQVFIDHFGLKRGHIIKAQLHPHRENESCPFAISIETVMDRDPETLSEIVPFTERVPYYPTERILLESSESEGKWDNLSMRVVDCLTPVGLGQRGLIVAPPRTGKTVLMQGMANAIQKNYPQAHLIILLVDERPEEVTDFRRQVSGEVISSTFDESAESHVHAAEMVIEKARRMVEVGRDVVILLDSITRLARAYNTTMPNSGKILSGGVEANALQKPKRFFGSARNIEDGGSLTILGTALVETGSKMDEVIFEEFKGTGNMELHLDRGLSDKRIYPALSMDKSGTRKEELLYHPDEMLKIYSLRRAMKGLPSTDAMEMLIQRIKKTQTNAEFLMSVAR
ncbi:MAG: transcription termination factor Rho [Opitutales bacterium]